MLKKLIRNTYGMNDNSVLIQVNALSMIYK